MEDTPFFGMTQFLKKITDGYLRAFNRELGDEYSFVFPTTDSRNINRNLERCVQVTRRDRVPNVHITERMGVAVRINETIRKRRLRWLGHCQRWPHRIIHWRHQGKRERERPRSRWLEGAREMADRGLEEFIHILSIEIVNFHVIMLLYLLSGFTENIYSNLAVLGRSAEIRKDTPDLRKKE